MNSKNKKSLLIESKKILLKQNQYKSPMDVLLADETFLLKLLDHACNNIDYFCIYLGEIYNYYTISNDSKTDYALEELLEKSHDTINFPNLKETILNNGLFTHSCNGSMTELIMQNGLGSKLNKNEELCSALNFLEEKLGVTGIYSNRQTNRSDEVYFTSPGATSFGYACNFAPERLFLGILKQDYENPLNVKYGENKIDYYRKVLYQKFDVLDEETKEKIEFVLNGFFSKSNSVIGFPIKEVIDSENIYFEIVKDTNSIDLRKHINNNCSLGDYTNFFTTQIGSNTNTNNLDNLVMIDTVIPPEKLHVLSVPDRYDLIQLIAKNKGLNPNDEINYFTLEPMNNKNTSK